LFFESFDIGFLKEKEISDFGNDAGFVFANDGNCSEFFHGRFTRPGKSFLTKASIIFVQSMVLSGEIFGKPTGMDFHSVTAATCILSRARYGDFQIRDKSALSRSKNNLIAL
jgi:hypothetical protein